MWKALFISVLLAGCAQLPPTPEDIQAKRFEPVPGKAVIYIVRDNVGAHLDHSVWLDDATMITTHTGTYYRWEVAPGTHRIRGGGEATSLLTLNAEAGKIYFVRHIVNGIEWNAAYNTGLQRLDDATGRARVGQATLL
ncbi:MAG TPA: DUF2846 domain-containing protein [Burkholderiales bacterium]|nr:DUF2846 domain-containing protein [Burkholderiales bacterium]